ncbi:Glutamate--UDP-2-acetamido-2-deoxy-D-ribohex-3-uluronic acid aminotransferase (PLP cofactor) [Dissulfuribacter thermophilus]|uniref:Glutamate--UDP-2-acetamido-2-deoxy-D-ribohex-3-uluronic acid aminotransferase (PLP cofactor) n=1 Tax=Dissulfuribacter thermophilus TaxID=1156395 RepID=A0A1B9F4B1_9BACT|nr:aminotransferase class I/II-fold pyridoxal phosphate-dependent enzyme [Dissulfuribacter thermophilus]OCC14655.1 Glutamate--UDP-2-acetamido-2-deoxy-D-ribohex-3-uluronic acid aminotransferase (PLP cofactor) [Dissulfuribacter thermophilus]
MTIKFQNTYQRAFKLKIAEYLGINAKNIFLFWKGRVALYAILKAIGIKKGDEVILPAFTCVATVNPIIYLSAKPIYVDIDPKTYNLDPNKIEEKITPKTKAILAQNTFGLSADLEHILEIAKKYDLFVIEDCAHGFGGFYKGKPNGTIADAAFFSTQWNKPFSTGLGGIAVTKRKELAEKLNVLENDFAEPSLKDKITLNFLIFIKKHFFNTNTYWFALKTYRWLSKYNLILGSSQGEELEAPVKPEDFEKVFSTVQARKGIEELKKIGDLVFHRKNIAELYKAILKKFGIEPPHEPIYAEHTYLKFPLLVKNRYFFFKKAEKEKIELGDWFISPIHPITENLQYWHYKWGENFIAEKISGHIINLPTHSQIDQSYVHKIEDFLRRNQSNIYSSYRELL